MFAVWGYLDTPNGTSHNLSEVPVTILGPAKKTPGNGAEGKEVRKMVNCECTWEECEEAAPTGTPD